MSEMGLASLRHKCQSLYSARSDDVVLGRCLSGLYYCFKSLKFVPPRTRQLLEGKYDDVMQSGAADEACYLSEMMIRSAHPCGDLLAQVVNICVLDAKHGRTVVSLRRVLEDNTMPDDLANVLTQIKDSREYDYISEFTNTSKHREFVRRVILHEDNHHRVEFQSFTRRDGKQERRRDFTHVVVDVERLMQMIDDALSDLLKREGLDVATIESFDHTAEMQADVSSVQLSATAESYHFRDKP